MSTWQIFSDAGNSFRWQCSHVKLLGEPQKAPIEKPSSPHHLPSIADLLVQGYSKLYGNQSDETETPPSFHTGLGKPVVVKQSSLVKASSILEDQDNGTTVISKTGYSKLYENQHGEIETPPSFRTGLGKPVVVKQSSLVKASSILVEDQDNGTTVISKTGYSKLYDNQSSEIETPPSFRTGLGKLVAVKESSLVKASSILGDEDDGTTVGYSKLHKNQTGEIETPPTFRTGSGKPVVVKQSSLVKASSILGDQNNGATVLSKSGFSKLYENQSDEVETPPTFKTGLGKPVVVKQSLLMKASSILGDQDYGATTDTGCVKVTEDNNNGQTETPLTFQTGSGKLFAAKKSSMERALSILGDQDEDWTGGSFGQDDGTGFLNSMFQTGSGKAVNINSTGLIKAKSLLGFEENSVLSTSKPPPIKFQTAGGRSVKVSGDALKRARTLLGDPELGNFLKEGTNKNMLDKENNVSTPFSDVIIPKAYQKSSKFISPVKSVLSDKKTAARFENIGLRSNLIKEFDAAENDNTIKEYNRVPLVDISNNISLKNEVIGEKRKPSSRIYPSPFKKPRNSKFVPPLNKKSTVVCNGIIPKIPEVSSSCKKIVSTRYPFQFSRKYIKEYFEEPPFFHKMFENLPEWLRKINSENSNKHMFEDESGLKSIGVDTFTHMLVQLGCSISKEWIANHYRWIVWKLACYERCYPAKFSGKLLTASNVLEELKYRYEREVNNGQRSALKRILEGDAPPSSHLVLCIASIQLKCNEEQDEDILSTVTSIELTDGWYSVNGLLDDLLLKQLVAGKLFVGQKLRICGASLSGWNAPVSPLEASRTISLCLHMNGTYKAHWAERLGFCKKGCVPLSLNCIKGSGGAVPSTLVGVTRIYPVLYRERLSDGGFVVRSERMESKRMQLYDYRRTSIVEGVMSEFQRGFKSFQIDTHQNDEGEKISLLLEKSAEPEVIMAEMTSEQLTSFATYQAKIEASRQSEMEKSIKKALEEAGLNRNEVNTLMRVRVVGLINKNNIHKTTPRQGLITIWNPTEKQQSELVEGQAYNVAGLTPVNSDSSTIYLRASGSTNKWRPLSPFSTQHFLPFFSPRKPVSLSKMGEVPISSEFDVAAFVVYVGDVHKFGHEKRQWVFVTDGTCNSQSNPHELSDSLLAISFFSPSVDCDSIVPINYNLVGSTVGFCNLIKRAKDQSNCIWVAEATENSTYFLSYDSGNSKHLKDAAASADRWAKSSTLIIEKLKGKISSMVARKV
ncbi:hypothetical protein L1887_04760 [Cichorium endivia]|nr:hypothetical protein L1887_04760 [Cichorium endivia]